MSTGPCIACGTERRLFLDLGFTPLANAYLKPEDAEQDEPFFPLRVAWCPACFLVQLADLVDPGVMFSHYLYFSSFSPAFVKHAQGMAHWLMDVRQLNAGSLVVELASNDGYLLQHFKEAGIPVLGVDPAENVAAEAIKKGIPTRVAFFGSEEAQAMVDEGTRADVIIGNNVLAHVPDPVDFLKGAALLLKDDGLAVFEFPHLLELLHQGQFDTIYHEHVSYYSLLAIQNLAAQAGLTVVDVSRQPVHGGSLRVSLAKTGDPSEAVTALLGEEGEAGLDQWATFEAFGEKVTRVVADLKKFLAAAKQEGKRVAAYGAAAKGNTLLNVAGVTPDDIVYVADRNTHKVGHLTPGAHLPIVPAEKLAQDQPDFVVVLAWNFEAEIRQQQEAYLNAGGRFVIPVPELRVDGR